MHVRSLAWPDSTLTKGKSLVNCHRAICSGIDLVEVLTSRCCVHTCIAWAAAWSLYSLQVSSLNFYSKVHPHPLIIHWEYGGCQKQLVLWQFTRLFLTMRVESSHARLHFISKQVQVTRGGATPSGTLESSLSISQVRALAKSSMLHQDTERTGFGNSYVQMCIHFRPVLANAIMHNLFSSQFKIVIAPPIS